MSKKTLIICYRMVPYCESWGNCQRIFNLAEYLSKSGLEIVVISSADQEKNNDLIYGPSFKQEFVDHTLKWKRRKHSSPLNNSGGHHKKSVLFRAIKRVLINFERCVLNEPCCSEGVKGFLFSIEASKKIQSYLDEDSVNNIIISGPPFSLFIMTKWKFLFRQKIPIILDYRDPWNSWNGGTIISRSIERLITKESAGVVVTTQTLLKDLKKRFKIRKSCVVANGFNKEEWEKVERDQITPADQRKKIVVSYVGDLAFGNGSFRDFTEFFIAYDNFEFKERLQIRFIGVTENETLKSLKDKYQSIDFIGKVSPIKSYEYMLSSDVLMTIHTSNDRSSEFLIGGKVYDYLKANKPIFIINSPWAFEKVFLENKTKIFFAENQNTKIKKQLSEIVNYKSNYQENKKNNWDNYSRDYQNEKYLSFLENINHRK